MSLIGVVREDELLEMVVAVDHPPTLTGCDKDPLANLPSCVF
jgi:hypothetical protein